MNAMTMMKAAILTAAVVCIDLAMSMTAVGGLTSYWTFDDDTANDTIGTNNAAAGTSTTLGVAGIIGNGIDLAGQPGNQFEAHVEVPAGHTLNAATNATNQTTMEAWFQADDISTNNYSEIIRQQGPQYKFMSFQSHGTRMRFQLESSYIDVTGLTAAQFEDGNWHHVAGTYDGSVQRFYIDGAEVANKTVSMTLSGSSPPAFVMGNLNLGGGSTYSEAFDGRMDEMAVWDEALSADEIKHQWVNRQPYTTRLGTGSAYENKVLGDGPTHYWRLGEPDGTMAVNLANVGVDNGTYTGGVTLGEPGAIVVDSDTAVRVDGSTGYVDVGDLGARPAQGTIEFWMNPDVVENYNNVFSTSGAAGVNQGFRFEERTGGAFSVYAGDDAGSYQAHRFTDSLDAGEWYHVVLTWDETGNNVTGYLNGVEKFNEPHSKTFVTNFSDVEIGRGFSAGRAWDGLVDEVAMYDFALTADQVEAHYMARIPEPSTLLLAGIGLLALVGLRRRKRK